MTVTTEAMMAKGGITSPQCDTINGLAVTAINQVLDKRNINLILPDVPCSKVNVLNL
ncbi:MAG: hypothetical protein ACXV5N_10620 [Halobacteriota archaeon]